MDYCQVPGSFRNLTYEVVWHDEWIKENPEWYVKAKKLHDLHTGIGDMENDNDTTGKF